MYCKLNITRKLFPLVTFVLHRIHPSTAIRIMVLGETPTIGLSPDHWLQRLLGMIPPFVGLPQHIVYGTPFLTVVYDHLGLAVGLACMRVCTFKCT